MLQDIEVGEVKVGRILPNHNTFRGRVNLAFQPAVMQTICFEFGWKHELFVGFS